MEQKRAVKLTLRRVEDVSMETGRGGDVCTKEGESAFVMGNRERSETYSQESLTS
jgi:hypothetical protein